MRPHKEEPIRVWLAVGGNRIEYPRKVTTKTAYLATFKIHIHSMISTRVARYSGWEIGNYYLEIPIVWSEYMRIHIILIPTNSIAHYKLNDLVGSYGWIYMEIIQVMYGLPQAVILANNLLTQHLSNHGYYQIKNNTRFMNTCLETYSLYIGSGRFWDQLSWTGEYISSDECTKNILWKYHNRFGREVIPQYNNWMVIYKTVCRLINAWICKRTFAPIWS